MTKDVLVCPDTNALIRNLVRELDGDVLFRVVGPKERLEVIKDDIKAM